MVSMRFRLSLWFPIEETQSSYGEMKVEMGRRVIERDRQALRPTSRPHDPAYHVHPRHMGTMFGAPGGDYCHGLIIPSRWAPTARGPKAMSINRSRSMGCTSVVRVTAGLASFIPGYNAALEVLADVKLIAGGTRLGSPVSTSLASAGSDACRRLCDDPE